MTEEILTAEQVLTEVNDTCANPLVAEAICQSFKKTGKMPLAVLISLNLTPLTVWVRNKVDTST